MEEVHDAEAWIREAVDREQKRKAGLCGENGQVEATRITQPEREGSMAGHDGPPGELPNGSRAGAAGPQRQTRRADRGGDAPGVARLTPSDQPEGTTGGTEEPAPPRRPGAYVAPQEHVLHGLQGGLQATRQDGGARDDRGAVAESRAAHNPASRPGEGEEGGSGPRPETAEATALHGAGQDAGG